MKIKINVLDILVISGSLIFSYGLWRVFPPAAYMALGAWMAVLGMIGSKKWV